MKIIKQYRPTKHSAILFVLFNIWLIYLWLLPNTMDIASNYFHFSFLGILGAIFANATGAGGGVVFIPTFNQLGFTDMQAVATSFGIQCFGMTAGAITWWRFYKAEQHANINWQILPRTITILSLCSIVGIVATYTFDISPPASLVQIFKIFSIILGCAILIVAWLMNDNAPRISLTSFDWLILTVTALFGGVITAWLSVGVGELIAIYLILRRFEVMLAIAVAVIVSAFSVWVAAIDQVFLGEHAYWQVIIFAGPGAVIGGLVAKKLVSLLPAKQVKIFFALWVLVIGLFS